MAKIEVSPAGCWLWTGPLDKDGYGDFYLRRRNRRAHRVGWFLMNGPIPTGLVINHKCPYRHCVNPQHLDAVSVRENALRDSRSVGAVNARKTHCPRGHPYNKVVVVAGKQERVCSICEKEKKSRLRRKWIAEDALNV